MNTLSLPVVEEIPAVEIPIVELPPTEVEVPAVEVLEPVPIIVPVPNTDPPPKISKQAIRTSLRASTLDGVFATIFSNITGGVLLVNFLLKLGATPVEIGLLSSIPMLVNFLQPLGAYFADRLTSRHWYLMALFTPSRLLWLFLVGGIGWYCCTNTPSHQVIIWTLAIMLVSNIVGALGGCAWFSWMAALVPSRLRGRYFGFRNSAASFTNLVSVPLLGFAVSAWPGGSIQGYGMLLVLGVAIGLMSLGCQFFITDVNPQTTHPNASSPQPEEKASSKSAKFRIFKDTNFLKFLLYFGLWTFAINLSGPFFNLYMLNDLDLDISTVTLYASLVAGANLVMLIFWGKLADRVGNRPLLLLVGIVVAITPLFWLGIGTDSVSLWVWLPLIHLAIGGFGAAPDLCNGNIQMELAPMHRPSQYFAIAAAIGGVCGGLGSTAGGFLAQLDIIGGLPGLFVISAVVRLIALLPLIFVREPRSQPVFQVIQHTLRMKLQPVLVPIVRVRFRHID